MTILTQFIFDGEITEITLLDLLAIPIDIIIGIILLPIVLLFVLNTFLRSVFVWRKND